MSDPTLTHIAWARTRLPQFRFSLADSAIAPPDLAPLGLPALDPTPAEGYAILDRLEAALGERYRAPGDRVQLCAGASEANAVVFGALLAAGDEALVELPGYEPHVMVPERFGARVRRLRRPLGAAPGAVATAVEAALTKATRLLVLSSPHNPSGALLEAADLEALDAIAERHHLWLLCDETFRDAAAGVALGTVAERGERWIATSSLTKSYGLGGLRVGWIAGAPAVLARCRAMQDLLSALPALPSLVLAELLLPHLDSLRERTHAILAANHTAWRAAAPRLTALTVPAVSRATTAWALLDGSGRGDAFAEFAAERFELGLAPGRFFGDPDGVRITLGALPDRFAASLQVLASALAAFGSPASVPPAGDRGGVAIPETR